MQHNLKSAAAEIQISKQAVEQLMNGKTTLSQFLGLSQEDLYRIAQIGRHLLASGQLAQARQIYEGLVVASPFNSDFYCLLGVIYHRLGEMDPAEQAYSMALQCNRRNGDALAGRGELRLQQGRTDEALPDLQAAVQLDPNGQIETAARARVLLESMETHTTITDKPSV
jgi:tetratricopeptide (TPR) repeat protein